MFSGGCFSYMQVNKYDRINYCSACIGWFNKTFIRTFNEAFSYCKFLNHQLSVVIRGIFMQMSYLD